MNKTEKFYEAWHYLYEHKMFQDDTETSHFPVALDIEVVKINPEMKKISDYKELNTEVEIWLECGPMEKIKILGNNKFLPSHDIELDCGASTFEEAIIKLAKLIKKHYGK